MRLSESLLIFRMNLGSLILEMGALSRLTGDPKYESAALRSLRKLWSMRSSLNLLGTTLDVSTGEWIEYSSGIGAGRFSHGFRSLMYCICIVVHCVSQIGNDQHFIVYSLNGILLRCIPLNFIPDCI